MILKYFKKAKAIWGKDKTKELNSSLFFKCSFNYNEDLKLIITANNFYRVYINGRFIFYGPARDAHEFYRVDTYKLENIKKKNNIIVIEVSGANCNSFYALNCEPFLCCELRNNKRVFRYTGKHFSCFNNDTRLRKVSRFSYQRAFSESYKIDGSFNEFLTKKVSKYQEIDVVRVEKKNFTDRLVDYPQLSFKKYKRFEDGNINFDLKLIC